MEMIKIIDDEKIFLIKNVGIISVQKLVIKEKVGEYQNVV